MEVRREERGGEMHSVTPLVVYFAVDFIVLSLSSCASHNGLKKKPAA